MRLSLCAGALSGVGSFPPVPVTGSSHGREPTVSCTWFQFRKAPSNAEMLGLPRWASGSLGSIPGHKSRSHMPRN